MKNVNSLIDKYSDLIKESLTLQSTIKKFERDILKQMWNIEVGTIVKDTKNGTIYKISSIDRSYTQSIISDVQSELTDIPKPWVMGFKQKKDGTYAKNTSNLYKNWEVIT